MTSTPSAQGPRRLSLALQARPPGFKFPARQRSNRRHQHRHHSNNTQRQNRPVRARPTPRLREQAQLKLQSALHASDSQARLQVAMQTAQVGSESDDRV